MSEDSHSFYMIFFCREKHDHWYEMTNFNEGPSINISVRRTHLYEDAFDKLSPDNGKYNFVNVYEKTSHFNCTFCKRQ